MLNVCVLTIVYIGISFSNKNVFAEKKYSNKDIMAELQKQSTQMGRVQMSLCNTANSLIGTLNRNIQQTDDERNPKKLHQQHQEMDSSDDAHQYQ